MNKILFILFFFSLTSIQGQISQKYNAPRNGDILIKQEVMYKDPGRSGENVIWDFGKLTPVNDEYTVIYSAPELISNSFYVMGEDTFPAHEVNPEDLIIGTEKEMDYYYRIKDGLLTLSGCEDQNSKLVYTPAMPMLSYRLAGTQNIAQPYTSKVQYYRAGNTSFKGEINLETDASGIMILPNKDTLKNVTRVHKTVTMVEQPNASGEYLSGFQVNCRMEYYQWYVKGYRYPIFETWKHYMIQDGEENNYFSTALFFPPQKQYYQEEDIAVDSEMDRHNIPEDATANLINNDSITGLYSHIIPETIAEGDDTDIDTHFPVISWMDANFTYNYFPNPMVYNLNVEYNLYDHATVSISLFKTDGILIKALPPAKRTPGLYGEIIDCSSLPAGSYILLIKVNEHTRSHVLMKR